MPVRPGRRGCWLRRDGRAPDRRPSLPPPPPRLPPAPAWPAQVSAKRGALPPPGPPSTPPPLALGAGFPRRDLDSPKRDQNVLCQSCDRTPTRDPDVPEQPGPFLWTPPPIFILTPIPGSRTFSGTPHPRHFACAVPPTPCSPQPGAQPSPRRLRDHQAMAHAALSPSQQRP